MGFDEAYQDDPAMFGVAPEATLRRFLDRLDPGQPVLDVGAGQGRNALYLARAGLTVDALDPSVPAMERLAGRAQQEGLPLWAHAGRFEAFEPVGTYGTILLYGLFPILTRVEIERAVARSTALIAPGGVVFVTAFTTEDAGYEARREAGRPMIALHSFEEPDGGVRTWLEPGELRSLFVDWDEVWYREAIGPDHRHGRSPPERHAWVEAVFVGG